jgi:hypothetical protein
MMVLKKCISSKTLKMSRMLKKRAGTILLNVEDADDVEKVESI